MDQLIIRSVFRPLLLALLSLGYLWFRLLSGLGLEWDTNPQYGYGWVVPFLMAGLIAMRWHSMSAEEGGQRIAPCKAESSKLKAEIQTTSGQRDVVLWVAAAMLALLYLPTRLIGEAVPEWRPLEWSLGIVTVGMTFCLLWALGGTSLVRKLAFPVAFIFVAIPWPTPIEAPIIQAMSRFNASMVVEVMSFLGIPAMQHGNVIEVATGVVGVDDACSGIRSFQSSLMISLFLGEFYGLTRFRRWLFVPLGFVVAIILNVCRTSLLTYIAATKGTAAIADYHDGAGITIMAGCSLVLWGIGVLLAKSKPEDRGQTAEDRGQRTEDGGQRTETASAIDQSSVIRHPSSDSRPPTSASSSKFDVGSSMLNVGCSSSAPSTSDLRPLTSASAPLTSVFGFQLSTFNSPLLPGSVLRRLSSSLLIWLVLVELGVQAWYWHIEKGIVPGPGWTLNLPEKASGYRTIPLAKATQELLRADESKQGQWAQADGTSWTGFYYNWLPGRTAGYLAKRHTPEICMAATGRELKSGPDLFVAKMKGVALPIRSYVFSTPNGPLYVFHCRWELGAKAESFQQHESSRFNLVRAIWAGRGRHGQKVFEFIMSGYQDATQAKAALLNELEKMMRTNEA